MAAERATPISLLDVLRSETVLPSSALLRLALDVFEPIAAGKVDVALGPRRSGSRHVLANVQLGDLAALPVPEPDQAAAVLDDVLSEELARVAPDGWDDWDMRAHEGAGEKPPADAPRAAAFPIRPELRAGSGAEEFVTLDSDE